MLVATPSSKSQTKAMSLFSICVHFSDSLECLNMNIHLQPGIIHKPDNTADQIHEQQHLSTISGGMEKVKNTTAMTGTKDTYTIDIINHVIDMGKWLWKCVEGQLRVSEAEIHAKLEKEL